MPRKKVHESGRRRCVEACGNCKRRKERCDGSQPCGRCLERAVHDECLFAGAPSIAELPKAPCLHLSEDMADTSDVELAIEHLMNLDNDRSGEESRSLPWQYSPASSAATMPHLSRLIRDAKGKFMFIGDSANLSPLQNIRRLGRIYRTLSLRHRSATILYRGRHSSWTSELDRSPFSRCCSKAQSVRGDRPSSPIHAGNELCPRSL
jgi:hypothetical protein